MASAPAAASAARPPRVRTASPMEGTQKLADKLGRRRMEALLRLLDTQDTATRRTTRSLTNWLASEIIPALKKPGTREAAGAPVGQRLLRRLGGYPHAERLDSRRDSREDGALFAMCRQLAWKRGAPGRVCVRERKFWRSWRTSTLFTLRLRRPLDTSLPEGYKLYIKKTGSDATLECVAVQTDRGAACVRVTVGRRATMPRDATHVEGVAAAAGSASPFSALLHEAHGVHETAALPFLLDVPGMARPRQTDAMAIAVEGDMKETFMLTAEKRDALGDAADRLAAQPAATRWKAQGREARAAELANVLRRRNLFGITKTAARAFVARASVADAGAVAASLEQVRVPRPPPADDDSSYWALGHRLGQAMAGTAPGSTSPGLQQFLIGLREAAGGDMTVAEDLGVAVTAFATSSETGGLLLAAPAEGAQLQGRSAAAGPTREAADFMRRLLATAAGVTDAESLEFWNVGPDRAKALVDANNVRFAELSDFQPQSMFPPGSQMSSQGSVHGEAGSPVRAFVGLPRESVAAVARQQQAKLAATLKIILSGHPALVAMIWSEMPASRESTASLRQSFATQVAQRLRPPLLNLLATWVYPTCSAAQYAMGYQNGLRLMYEAAGLPISMVPPWGAVELTREHLMRPFRECLRPSEEQMAKDPVDRDAHHRQSSSVTVDVEPMLRLHFSPRPRRECVKAGLHYARIRRQRVQEAYGEDTFWVLCVTRVADATVDDPTDFDTMQVGMSCVCLDVQLGHGGWSGEARGIVRRVLAYDGALRAYEIEVEQLAGQGFEVSNGEDARPVEIAGVRGFVITSSREDQRSGLAFAMQEETADGLEIVHVILQADAAQMIDQVRASPPPPPPPTAVHFCGKGPAVGVTRGVCLRAQLRE